MKSKPLANFFFRVGRAFNYDTCPYCGAERVSKIVKQGSVTHYFKECNTPRCHGRHHHIYPSCKLCRQEVDQFASYNVKEGVADEHDFRNWKDRLAFYQRWA